MASTDLAYAAPTESNGYPFDGAVAPSNGALLPLEGSVLTLIPSSPTGKSTVRLVVDTRVDQPNTSYTPASGITTPNADNLFTFSSKVNHWTLQNNSSVTVYYMLDAAASTGSFQLPANSQTSWDWSVTVLHIYTTSALPINAALGLVLLGRP